LHAAQQPPFATTAVIYIVAIALFVWRTVRPQRLSLVRLWIMPIVLLGLTVFAIYANIYASALQGEMPAPAWQIVIVLFLGAALGIPLGFLRGRHSEVKPTDRPGVMYVHSSPLIVVIWLLAFVARAAVRAYLPHVQSGAALGGDGLLAFAMSAIITSYYAIYKKYRTAVQQAPAT
jgi:energy-coupling factor transporter transmembrane protein EcfT